MTFLEVQQLNVMLTEKGPDAKIVSDLGLKLDRGETLAIVGESGSGKTVTALSIMRLLEYNVPATVSGSIKMDDTEILALSGTQLRRYRANKMGMIFQEGLGSLNPLQRIQDQLIEADLYKHKQTPRAERKGSRRTIERLAIEKAKAILQHVGLIDTQRIFNLYPHQMSGGMQQRVMIAMALMSEPDLLIADEPTTALDVTTQDEILTLIKRVQRERQMGCIFITHDLAVAAQISDRIGVMYSGSLVEIGPTEEILTRPRHHYTRALLECVPRSDVFNLGHLPSIPGSVPAPTDAIAGCRFADRCGFTVEACISERPRMHRLEGAESEAACWNPAVGPLDARPSESTLSTVSDEPLAVVKQLKKAFQLGSKSKISHLLRSSAEHVAVHDITLDIHRGEFFGLVGESGSGKTTFGRMLAGLEVPTSGSTQIHVGDNWLAPTQEKKFRRKVQFIYQDPQGSLDPRQSVRQVIGEPLRELMGLRGTELQLRIEELLLEVGLGPHYADRLPSELSGGQRQRIAIARALAPEPDLIVADEPTSALDVSVQGQVMNLLLKLQRDRGLAFVFITHNLSLITSVADRVGVMRNGRLLEVGDSRSIVRAPEHEYTRHLLSVNPTINTSMPLVG